MLIPLLKNSIYCKNCKTEVISKNRHHFAGCKCKDLNKKCYTYGGSDYQITTYGDKSDFVVTSVYDNGKLETRQKFLIWGTFGKNKDNFEYKLLNDLSDNHLCAILNTQKNIPDVYKQTIEDLIIIREQTNSMIHD